MSKKKHKRHQRGGVMETFRNFLWESEREPAAYVACASDKPGGAPIGSTAIYNTEVRLLGALVKGFGLPASRGNEEPPQWILPKESCDLHYEKTTRAAGNTCLYAAAKDYLESWFGRRMEEADRDFFSMHPLATADGVPLEHTLRVLHELIAPYGVGISKVILPLGVSMAAELQPWVMALGCNPMALADRRTSNADFAKAAGMSLAAAERLYRVEFAERMVRPAIYCGAWNVTFGDGKSGLPSGGGHAEYVGVRTPHTKSPPYMQIQLDWLRDMEPINIDLPASEVVSPLFVARIYPYASKLPDGRLITALDNDPDLVDHALTFFATFKHIEKPSKDTFANARRPIVVQSWRDGDDYWQRGGSTVSLPSPTAGHTRCTVCSVYWPSDKMWASGICLKCAGSEIFGGFQCHLKSQGRCASDWHAEAPQFVSVSCEAEGNYVVEVRCRTCKTVNLIKGWGIPFMRLYNATKYPMSQSTSTGQGALWDRDA